MSEESPQPGEHMHYRSPWMIAVVILSLMFFSFGLIQIIEAIIVILRGGSSVDTCTLSFFILWTAGVGFGAFRTAIEVETSIAGIQITYLLFKSRWIHWQEIHELRTRNLGQYCVIKHGQRPVKRKFFILGHFFQVDRSNRDLLINTIVSYAQLKQAGRDSWGYPIYKREEAIDEGDGKEGQQA